MRLIHSLAVLALIGATTVPALALQEAPSLPGMPLLRAWVERDLKDMRHYLAAGGEGVASWLGIDLDVLSRRVSDALFSIADRTVIDRLRFEDDLEAARADYCEGEMIAPGLLSCVHCGSEVTLSEVARLEPCHQCGHRYFARGPQAASQ